MTEVKRNLKSLNNKTGRKIVAGIESIIEACNRYKNCYFWTPQGNASSRRAEGFDTELIFSLNGVKYRVVQGLRISCRNFHFSTQVYRDEKRSNITVLKNILKRYEMEVEIKALAAAKAADQNRKIVEDETIEDWQETFEAIYSNISSEKEKCNS